MSATPVGLRTMVWRYGLLEPDKNAVRVEQQMRGAHEYRNKLVELERARRIRLRELSSAEVRDMQRQVAEAAAVVDGVVKEIRLERARARKRHESESLRASLREAKERLKHARAAWFAARKAEDAAFASQRDEVNEWWLAQRRELRPGLSKSDDGLRAGTYQLVEDAASQSAGSLPLWDGHEPQDPRFVRWDGDGFVSEQVPGGASLSDVMAGTHSQIRITEQPAGTDRRVPGSKRSMTRKRMLLWLRVGSDADRQPVWACWPMLMHRPFPSDTVIQRATVRRRFIGPRAEWCVEFVVRCNENRRGGVGVVAMDVGWRATQAGLRVAVTFDEDGQHREFLLPARIASGLDVPNGLRSVRDKAFDAARDGLAAWLDNGNGSELLRGKCDTIRSWRSCARLASVVKQWAGNRFDGDAAAYEAAEAWRYHDYHLWAWETSQRTGAIRARTDWFRRVAAEMAERYGVLVLEKFDLRKMALRQPVESQQRDNEASRSNRVMVAVGEFRQALRNAFAIRGGQVVEVDATNTTRACAVCGVVEDFDAASMLRHRCVNGHEWDQDENAARNILERWSGATDAGAARSDDGQRESRRDRVARLRREKLDRMNRSREGEQQAMASEVG